MDDSAFAQLLEFFKGSWKGYRKVRKGVKRRVDRHMEKLGCPTMADYLDRLAHDPDALAESRRRMTVPISRFFRDRRLWDILGERVIPELIGTVDDPVRIWFAGCSRGEEPYSFRMLWEEMRDRHPSMPRLEMIATDLDPERINQAKAGIYLPSSLREVDAARRERFFIKTGNRFAVLHEISEEISWSVHDLLSSPPPGTDFHILFLRNSILTYELPERRDKAFLRAIEALRAGGLLVIGAKEEMPAAAEAVFFRYDRYVYRKEPWMR